jgi:hypothetical protein
MIINKGGDIMCPDSGCIITDFISWLWRILMTDFMIGAISGVVSGVIVIIVGILSRNWRLKKRWSWIAGKYRRIFF